MATFDFSLVDEHAIPPDALAEHEHKLRTLGFTVVPDFLRGSVCDGLRERLQAAIDAYVPVDSERSLHDRYLMHDLLAQDVAFGRLLEDPRLQQLLAPLLGEHWIMYAFTSSSLPPRGSNYGRRIHVDCPRFIPGYVTNMGVIWCLDDFTEATGGTEVLPGSHHDAQAPSEAFFQANHLDVRCARGSLVVFSGRLFHRSGMNATDRWRHALTMNACRSFMKQRMDWVRFIPDTIASELNGQARRLIGYDTRLPTSMEEFFRPEGERLYKPGQG